MIRLTEPLIAALFSEEDAGDGRALLARVPVRILRAEMGRDVSTAHVSVGALSVAVEMGVDGSVQPWCSHCGVTGCAHVAAGLFALVESDEPFGVGGAGHRAAAPAVRRESNALGAASPPVSWRGTLNELLGDGAADGEADVQEIALLFAVHGSRRGDDGGTAVVARPAVRGAKGAWVRGGISWRDVAESGDPDPRWHALAEIAALFSGRENHPAAVARMHNGSGWNAHRTPWGSPDWMRLDTVPARGLWELLRAAHDAGVWFVADTAAQEPVEVLPSGARAAIDLRARHGGLELEATIASAVDASDDRGEATASEPGQDASADPGDPVVVDIDPGVATAADSRMSTGGQDPTLPIGAPTTAVARVGAQPPRVVALHPLVTSASDEFDRLHARGVLTIPSRDVDGFIREYLPRLREVAPLISSDRSFSIPRPAPPALVLAVRHHDDVARLFWEWEYAPGELRQPAAEGELLDAVEASAGRYAHLLRRERASRVFPARDLDRDETVEFLAHVLPAVRRIEGLRVEAHDEVPAYSFATEDPKISFGVDPGGHDWLELNIVVTVQGEPVASGELLKALAQGRSYFRLLSGTVFPLTDPRFAKLRDVLMEARVLKDRPAGTYRVPRLDVDLWQELAGLGVISTQETQWFAAIRALGNDRVERRPVPAGFSAELRDYQVDGYSWLDFLRRNRMGGVLADDMGLGKTVQILAALEGARAEEPGARFLVVAPTSVVGHWVREAARFAPEMSAVAMTTTVRKRGTGVAEAAGNAAMIVTSYAIFRIDHDQFTRLGFRVLVLDEAQQVKNSSSKNHACVRSIDVPTKIAVTGTPLENNVMELFALTTLVAPGLFGTREHFRERFHRAIERRRGAKRLTELRARIRPFMLRRTKEQVAPELPSKTEQVLEIELSSAHRKAYERRFRREQQKLLGLLDDVEKHKIQILATLTILRRHALDPSFGDGDPDAVSAKLEALGDLLDEIVADGHRVLVFSQFTDFLGLAAQVADHRSIRYSYLDGRTAMRQRQRMIDRFSSGEVPAFFISLKAGGTGLNLTAADYCILLDPWWNPAAESQAVDRAHRIGQNKPVMVYRMIATGTIEQKVRELQDGKRRLFDEVLSGDGAGAVAFGADDFRALLR